MHHSKNPKNFKGRKALEDQNTYSHTYLLNIYFCNSEVLHLNVLHFNSINLLYLLNLNFELHSRNLNLLSFTQSICSLLGHFFPVQFTVNWAHNSRELSG